MFLLVGFLLYIIYQTDIVLIFSEVLGDYNIFVFRYYCVQNIN